MKSVVVDGCGCFPTGRHYAGIAHLLRAVIKGLVAEFTGDSHWHDHPIALLDVETTGRDASVDRIVEIGIVVGQRGEVVRRHNWLINPGQPIPAEASAVHHITDADVANEPRFEVVMKQVAEALTGCIPAAYNAAFDRAFLMNEFARAGHRAPPSIDGVADGTPPALRRDVEWFDPLVWAREVQRDERSRALGEVAARLGVKLENAHRASDDAEAAVMVLYRLATDARIPRSYGAFVQEQRRLSLIHADERRRYRF